MVESRTEMGLGFDPEAGSKGGNATCPFCGTVADSDYVKQEGNAGGLAFQAMAIAASGLGRKGKAYFSADDMSELVPDGAKVQERINLLSKATGITTPREPIINDAKGGTLLRVVRLEIMG